MNNNIKKSKFKFKPDIKILISHIFGLAALLAFAHFAILYSKGNFELPFYEKNKDNTAQLEHEVILPNRETTAEPITEATEDITNIKDIVHQDDLIEATAEEGEDIYAQTTESAFAFEFFSEDMARKGFAVSDGAYELYDEARIKNEISRYKAEVENILKNAAEEDPALPAEPLLYEYKFVQIAPEAKTPLSRSVTAASMNSMSKAAVETCMDYIIIRDGENETLCDAAGKIITRDFGLMNLEILKMRDKFGRTVFKTGGMYYIYDPKGGQNGEPAFVIIQFSELFGDRGVPFMYPSYYGAYGANGLDRANNPYNGKWGYNAADTQNAVVSKIYAKTFNFSENVGIAYQETPGRGKKLFFLDASGNSYLPNYCNYFAPETATKDHLGFFYFDHGLTRVYEREFDRKGHAITQRELIVNYYGAPFYIPEDYSIKAYSNGMILLEKDGYYGFMNYLGEWVYNPIYTYAQPFYEGVAAIGLSNGKKALVDTKGNLITKFKYDAITNCTGGVIALFEKGQGWTIINKVRRQIKIAAEN